ncbi:hypothetical protein KPATCC21470_0799 [Kitasatospora purpeofusca]
MPSLKSPCRSASQAEPRAEVLVANRRHSMALRQMTGAEPVSALVPSVVGPEDRPRT